MEQVETDLMDVQLEVSVNDFNKSFVESSQYNIAILIGFISL